MASYRTATVSVKQRLCCGTADVTTGSYVLCLFKTIIDG